MSQRPQRFGRFPLLVAGSVLLNVFLAAYLLKGNSKPPEAAAATSALASSDEAATVNPPDAKATAAALPLPEAEILLHWSTIESSDLRQYMANLRNAGCPEQVIHDIIIGDVSQMYSKRAREIWQLHTPEYWQRAKQEKPTAEQQKQLGDLQTEKQELLKDLLGKSVSSQELVDTVYLQLHGSERDVLFLPSDRRDTALQALEEIELKAKTFSTSDGDWFSRQQSEFNEKLTALAEVLSPSELEEFHVRNSPTSGVLKSEVRYFNLTAEEYLQLLKAKESSESGQGRNLTAGVVRDLFGAERAQEFERVSNGFYINAREGAESEGIALERVEQAAKIANDTVNAGFKTARDGSLSVDERKARIKELETQADAQIKNLMGATAPHAMLADLRNVLRSSARKLRP